MTQKSDAENPGDPKSASGSKTAKINPPVGAGAASAQRGARVQGQERKQYLIASRRAAGVSAFAVSPLTLNVVQQALQASPDIEVVDTLGPKAGVGALADGMPGAPHVIVARMDRNKAQMLCQQGQGQLIVEEDQPLTLLDAPLAPPMVTPSFAGVQTAAVPVVVIGPDETPIAGAEVYLYGS